MSEKKTAIVTGGSGGIGSEICRQLAVNGFNVVVHYGSSKVAAAEVCAEIESAGGIAMIASANISDEMEVAELFARVSARFGGVDVVVANAGMMRSGPVADFALSDFDTLISVNLRGAFLTLREAARAVRENGRIIFTSSQLAERPREGTGVYSATKAAVDAMLVSMSKELGKRGITINSVRPGATTPGMFDASDKERANKFEKLSAFNRLGTPQDIASVVSFLASDGAQWITGQHIRADGGMSN